MKPKEFIVPIILALLIVYFTFTLTDWLIRFQGGTGMISDVIAPVEFNQQDRIKINEIHRFLIEGFE